MHDDFEGYQVEALFETGFIEVYTLNGLMMEDHVNQALSFGHFEEDHNE